MSNDPLAPAPLLRATTETVALRQLTSAIAIWFDYGDPVSIHALAGNANACYHALGAGKGIPTIVELWWKSLTKAERKEARRARNFFHHGPERGEKPEVKFRPEYAELLIMDSMISHERLTGKRTPLMLCFFARLTWERPLLTNYLNAVRQQEGRELIVVDKADKRNREEFLREELPLATAAIAAGRDRPLHVVPPVEPGP